MPTGGRLGLHACDKVDLTVTAAHMREEEVQDIDVAVDGRVARGPVPMGGDSPEVERGEGAAALSRAGEEGERLGGERG